MAHDNISHALSPEARDYLAKVFNCTTHAHLLTLGEPSLDTMLNVFDENVKLHQGKDDSFYNDEEIASYINAVDEGREPYDPALHEFDVRKSNDDTWEMWVSGVATGDEWERLDSGLREKPGTQSCYYMFNQLVEPRGE